MKKILRHISGLGIISLALFASGTMSASPLPQSEENIIYIEPLFEYPVAPEDIQNLDGKSDWLMDHFWDNFDFKKKSAVDQNALNDAFRVYALPMRWASKAKVEESTDKLLASVSKNPVLLLQFTKAAEENLYGPRADVLIDEIYLKYLNAITANKKIPESRRLRYGRQKTMLENTLVGSIPPVFTFESPVGNQEKFRPGLLTVIEFGDPGCDDCRMAKLKMDTDVKFTDMVEKGLVNVMFIIPDPEEGWQTQLAGYPRTWHVGASDTISDQYDIRTTPTFYVVGTDGKIIVKTGSVEEAMSRALENVK